MNNLALRPLLFLFAFLLAFAGRVSAADAYLVRFNSQGRETSAGRVVWLDDVLFFNAGPASATVRFVGVSNAPAQNDPPALTLQPGHVVSLDATVGEQWEPRPEPGLYVLHLDIPPGVVVESRDEYYFDQAGVTGLFPTPMGKVSMPVFRELTPPGQPQVHLGTDLSATTSRINVGVYNAGAETATATIEVRRTCDDSIADARTLTIPPNTIVQTNGLVTGARTCGAASGSNSGYTRYTVVTVSQPSITYIANLDEFPVSLGAAAGVVPIVSLGVTQNTRY